jgi:hypothetical protein
MTSYLKPFQWLAVAAVVHASLAATAAVKPNPYEKIAERNLFNLLPIQVNPPGEVKPPDRRPPPKVFITGLVELGGVSKALVEINEPGHPVQRSILAAGGTSGALEVLNVDVAGERVRVRIDGDEETLSIEKPKPRPTPPLPPQLPHAPRPSAVFRG